MHPAAAHSRLGETLRMLMARRGMSGLEVSTAAEMSPAAFSRILTGKVRPRQGTLTKLFSILCKTPQEEQSLLSSYSGIPEAVGEDRPIPLLPDGTLSPAEMDRVARYLELKTMSIDFRESVGQALFATGVQFESYARHGNVVTDFLVRSPLRIAVECKFNVNRDWEREVGTSRLLRANLPCDRVIIVVPYLNDQAREASPALALCNASIVSVQDLANAISSSAGTGGR